MQKLQFTIETDYFHILPTQKFLKELIEASAETRSLIWLEIPYKRDELTDDFSVYSIKGKRTKNLVDITRALINTKQGGSVILTFDESVPQDYISDFKSKVEYLFK